MIRQFVLVFALLLAGAVCAEDFVTTVTARQVQPWNGLVEITVGLSCESNDLATLVCTFAATNSATRAALPVSKIRQVGGDTGSGTSWTRRFIWDAKADVGEVKIDDVVLVVDVFRGVQLWKNGPYWATCNIGASQPEECGYYFWWGDTVGYKRNSANNGWLSVKDGSSFSFSSGNCPTCGKSNSELQSAGYIDTTGNLVAEHDAATVHLGAPWRMPTDAEISALISNCTTTWTMRNDVSGRLITGKGAYASRSIFLPAAGSGNGSGHFYSESFGVYWSSTPYSDSSDFALDLFFSYSSYPGFDLFGSERHNGGGAFALCEDFRNSARISRVSRFIRFISNGNLQIDGNEEATYAGFGWVDVGNRFLCGNGAFCVGHANAFGVCWINLVGRLFA